MNQFHFSTTPSTPPADSPVTLLLCGEEMHVSRPKSMALLNAEQAISPMLDEQYGDDAEQVRANAIMNFLMNTFRTSGFMRFLDRAMDPSDPLDVDAIYRAMSSLVEHWGDNPDGAGTTLVINPSDDPAPNRPEGRLIVEDHQIDMPAHAPKDLLLMLVSALALNPEMRAQKLATERMLEAILDPADADEIKRRLSLPDDLDALDISDLDEPFNALIAFWFDEQPAPANRAERRAASRHTTATGQLPQQPQYQPQPGQHLPQ